MRGWNSTLKPGKPLQRKSFIRASKQKRVPGLAQRVAQAAGTAIRHLRGESSLLRSEAHRRNVAALPCACCGRPGPSQCAHINFNKGAGLKACDSLTFPACPDCHRNHDQGGMPRQERWRLEWEYVDATRADLIRRNQWSPEIESHYQRAIQPLARVVHPEGA